MSRYLTPSKVSLLALIWLYSTAKNPQNGFDEFALSSNQPILSFIISHILPGAPKNDSGRATLQLSDFKKCLQYLQSGERPGISCWAIFLEKLWKDFKCLDDLHSFFKFLPFDVFETTTEEEVQRRLDPELDNRPDMHDTTIARTSPLGIFVRRSCLEFTRLQFNDTLKLWESFICYRAPTEAFWRKNNPQFEGSSQSSALTKMPDLSDKNPLNEKAYGHLHDSTTSEGLASVEDVERLLEYQIEQLQKYGNRVPEEMKERFRAMVGPGISVPALSHFVKFFDAWRAGDYTSSFDNLHRYFDYTMSTQDKTYYQYALLHKAVLQADFGCFGEAYDAMQETIATARENQDMNCLNFSLSWLHHLSKAYPAQMRAAGYKGVIGSEREGLEFLESKAREARMWSLLSSTLLSQTKLGLSNGESVTRALEHLYQSSHLNLHHNLSNVTGAQKLMLSSVLSRLGLSETAKQQVIVSKFCYSRNSPVEETLRANCRLAHMTNMAGDYAKAMDLLNNIDPEIHRTLKFHQYLTAYSGMLKLKHELNKGNLVASSHLLSQLKDASPLDPELDLELAHFEFDYLIRQQKLPDAFVLIEGLAARLKDEGADLYQRVRLLSWKAKLFAKAGKPELGFSNALRAANVSLKAWIIPAAWEAIGVLCNILISLKEFKAAIQLLDAITPQALEGGDAMLCAELFATQADACMGEAGNREAGSREQGQSLSQAYRCVERALGWYEKVEDLHGRLEMLAKQAIIRKLMGDNRIADGKAAEYVHLHDEAMKRMKEESGPDMSFQLLAPSKEKG